MGDVRQMISGRNGQLHDLNELMRASLAKKAALLARQKGHPEAVAVAMVDPDAEVIEAKDSKTGGSRLILRSELEADRGRFQAIQTRKEPGSVLTVTADDAASYGLGQVVNDDDELKALYGLRGRAIRVDGPGWVDSLVTILTDPYVSWLLLFIGAFMLVIELKLPGIGLPAIISALAFLLFFWSHYLSGTADQLEIILFLIGLVCLAVEIFVFPGFGVFGMSGILLMLCSIVLASHTFIWPTQDYEYQELGHTLLQVTGMLAAVGGCAIVLARYFPSLPFFNRLVLKPEPWTARRGRRFAGQADRRRVRIAGVPDRRDGQDDLAVASDGQGAVRRYADRRHGRRRICRDATAWSRSSTCRGRVSSSREWGAERTATRCGADRPPAAGALAVRPAGVGERRASIESRPARACARSRNGRPGADLCEAGLAANGRPIASVSRWYRTATDIGHLTL